MTCIFAVLLTAASPSSAAVTRKKAIWGPLDFHGQSQFPVYAELGVGIYQWTLAWDRVAIARPRSPRDPADPAYRWPPEIDRAVAEAGLHGMTVSLAVRDTPGWANGGRASLWAPTQPNDFVNFIEAASRRYPRVHHWMIWVEPTNSKNFAPLTPDGGRPLRGAALRGPRLYARMLDGAYRALKRVSRRNLVIGGNTLMVGTVSPLRWIQALRLPNGKVPRMDLYGHNPFTQRSPDLQKPPLGNGFADFSDLDTLQGWLDRYLGHRKRKLRIFISEFSLPTDKENYLFSFFFTRAVQASWLTKALRIVRRSRRIYTFGYLGLVDEAARPDDRQARWGLIDPDGTRKPAFDAFRRG